MNFLSSLGFASCHYLIFDLFNPDCWDSDESPPPLPARTPESFILATGALVHRCFSLPPVTVTSLVLASGWLRWWVDLCVMKATAALVVCFRYKRWTFSVLFHTLIIEQNSIQSSDMFCHFSLFAIIVTGLGHTGALLTVF